jgi:phage major head subunit gpT-like protein
MGQIVNPVTLEKALRADFMKAYESTENTALLKAAMLVKSTAASEKFGWLGSVPTMQEFKDEKSPKGLLDYDFTIRNVPYEGTLKVDKFALRNDQMQGIQTRIKDLAARAKVFPAKLMMELVVAGSSGLCYDGQAFFSASHSEGASGTQSNLLSGTGVTLAQLKTDFDAAVAAMLGFKDDQGQPMQEDDSRMKLLIVAPGALRAKFQELLNSSFIATSDNVMKGAAELVISNRLTDANDWYLFDMGGVVKPLILQENMPVEFAALEGESTEGFMRRFYHYGVEWYGNVGYGMWQKAVKTTNS